MEDARILCALCAVAFAQRFGTGAYQSPIFYSLDELRAFFVEYRDYFESDGRHHVWIGSPNDEGLIIYDQHNVLFAYGDLSAYENVLMARGMSRKVFWFPSPHGHEYPPANAEREKALLACFLWRRSPLKEQDVW